MVACMNKALISILVFIELVLLITSPLAALASLMFLILISAFFSTVSTVVQAVVGDNSNKN